MSEDNKSFPAGERPQRTVRMKLHGKFGVSEERRDRGFRGPDNRVANERPARSAGSSDYRDRSNDRGGFRNDRSSAERGGERGGFRSDRPAFERGGERSGFRNDRSSAERGNDRGGFRSDRPAFERGGERGGFRNDRSSAERSNDRGGFRSDRPAFERGGERGGFRNDRPSFERSNDRGGFRNDRGNDRAGAGHKRFGNRDERRGERKVWSDQENTGAPIFRQRPAEKTPEFPVEEQPATENDPVVLEEESEKDPPWFRRILALSTEKGREREEKFLAEGIRVVLEMIQYHPDIVHGIYVTEGFTDDKLQEQARAANLRIHDLSAEQMGRVSTTVTGPGVVAVCRSASRKPDYDRAHVITLVDAIQDPGNLGALFRTSLGFGSGGMLLGKGTVNPFNPKVVRGSSGTFLRVPFEHGIDLSERIQFLRQKGYCIVATDLHAKQSLADISPRKLRKVALIMGNEGMGAEKGLIEQADEWVRIPMGESLESLNVAVAHGILSFQMAQLQEKN